MIEELDLIPKEIYEEAEKLGVLRNSIEIAAYADRNYEGVFCDNWILVTKNELVLIGGIQLVVPKNNVKKTDSKKLTVNFGKISAKYFDRTKLSEFRVEKQTSGCIVTALDNETKSYVLITYSTCSKEEELSELVDILNGENFENDSPNFSNGKFPKPSFGGFGGPGGPPGGFPGGPPNGFPGGPPPSNFDRKKSRNKKKNEDCCPKCGRKYPNDNNICPHCSCKSSVIKCLWGFVKKYKFSVGMIFLSMAIMTGLSVLSPYISTEFFYDKVLDVAGEFYGQILLVIGIIVSLRIFSLLAQMVSDIITARVVPKITYDLKKTIFTSIEKLSLGFFTGRRTGSLMTQVNGDANTIYWFFVEGLPYLIINIIQVVAVAVIMLLIDWRLTIISIVFFPLLVFVSTKLFRTMKKLHARSFSSSRAMSGQLSDMLGAVRVVKAFAGERNEVKSFDIKSETFAEDERKAGIFSNTAFPLASLIIVISGVLVTAIGGWFVIENTLTYGQLLAFIAYAGMLQSPIMFFINIVQSISNCFNATYRLMEVMDAEPEVFESKNPIVIKDFRGEVEFRNVSFGYDKTRKVIKNVSLSIKAGQKVGIVGHTGAGKSTIANLIIRLYDADTGEVLIDGINVKDVSFNSLRENIAIVSQETYLFSGTILENIKYAKPDATPEEIIVASKISGAHDFIIKLPDGYSTDLGTRNRQLSGGERQRISIARAILRNPKILILDEATSAMDTRTERSIQNALEKLCEGRTTIMIAHRLSTLRDCEKLLVIENGEVVESGTHLELLKEKGIYHNLYKLQYEALKDAGIEE